MFCVGGGSRRQAGVLRGRQSGGGAVKANGVPVITTNATTFPVRTPLEPHAYRGLDSSALNLRIWPTYSVGATVVSSSGGRPAGRQSGGGADIGHRQGAKVERGTRHRKSGPAGWCDRRSVGTFLGTSARRQVQPDGVRRNWPRRFYKERRAETARRNQAQKAQPKCETGALTN